MKVLTYYFHVVNLNIKKNIDNQNLKNLTVCTQNDIIM